MGKVPLHCCIPAQSWNSCIQSPSREWCRQGKNASPQSSPPFAISFPWKWNPPLAHRLRKGSPQVRNKLPLSQPVVSEDEVHVGQEESTQSDDAGVSFWGIPQTNASDDTPPIMPEEANSECKEEVSSTGTSDEETREEVIIIIIIIIVSY